MVEIDQKFKCSNKQIKYIKSHQIKKIEKTQVMPLFMEIKYTINKIKEEVISIIEDRVVMCNQMSNWFTAKINMELQLQMVKSKI